MPTAPSNTYSGKRTVPCYRPDEALPTAVNFIASINYVRGTLVGELTATPGTFKAYAAGNADGSQNPTGVLVYDISTDAATPIANVTLSPTAGQTGGEFGQTGKTAPIYQSGFFQASDLVGLDAAAIAKPGWRQVSGNLTAGVVSLGI